MKWLSDIWSRVTGSSTSSNSTTEKNSRSIWNSVVSFVTEVWTTVTNWFSTTFSGSGSGSDSSTTENNESSNDNDNSNDGTDDDKDNNSYANDNGNDQGKDGDVDNGGDVDKDNDEEEGEEDEEEDENNYEETTLEAEIILESAQKEELEEEIAEQLDELLGPAWDDEWFLTNSGQTPFELILEKRRLLKEREALIEALTEEAWTQLENGYNICIDVDIEETGRDYFSSRVEVDYDEIMEAFDDIAEELGIENTLWKDDRVYINQTQDFGDGENIGNLTIDIFDDNGKLLYSKKIMDIGCPIVSTVQLLYNMGVIDPDVPVTEAINEAIEFVVNERQDNWNKYYDTPAGKFVVSTKFMGDYVKYKTGDEYTLTEITTDYEYVQNELDQGGHALVSIKDNNPDASKRVFAIDDTTEGHIMTVQKNSASDNYLVDNANTTGGIANDTGENCFTFEEITDKIKYGFYVVIPYE